MKFNLSLFWLVLMLGLNAQNLKEKADNLYVNGNYSKAIETYNSVENLGEVYDEIAKAYIAIGNYDQGLVHYKKAIEANPEDLLIKYEYAKLLTRTKKYEEANQHFRSLILKDSLNPNYYYELGLVLEKQRDTTAIHNFIKTFNLDDSHQKAIFKIGKHHLIKRNYKVVHHFIDKGLESYANNVELISLKAQTYYYQDYYTQAIVWFNKLIDLGEESEFIHEKLSLCYAENSDYEDAINHRKEALKYNPTDANAMYVIGGYYERLNNFEKAEAYISAALKLKDLPLSHEYQKLGTLLNRQKKYEAAIKAFQTSLKEDPSNIFAEFYLVRTKDEFYADLDTKIKLYETYIKKHKTSPFIRFAETRLAELNKEKFLEEE